MNDQHERSEGVMGFYWDDNRNGVLSIQIRFFSDFIFRRIIFFSQNTARSEALCFLQCQKTGRVGGVESPLMFKIKYLVHQHYSPKPLVR